MDKQLDIITTSLEALLQRGTSPKNVGRDSAAIDAFCGLVNKEPDCIPTAAKLIVSKMQSMQEWEALQALQLLESCMLQCGSPFHAEVGKFRFLNELIKLISPKYLGNLTPESVRTEIVHLLYLWTLEYPKETKIREAYEMLKKQRVVQSDPIVSGRRAAPPPYTPTPSPSVSLNQSGSSTKPLAPPPARNTGTSSILEDESQSKLLQKLLQSKKPEDLQAANKLIKSMVSEEERKMEQRCKVMQEMESINNNASLLTEMLDNYTGDVNDWDLIKELHGTCEGFRSNLVTLAQHLPSGDDDLFQLVISTNESLSEVLAKYMSTLNNLSSLQTNTPLLDMSSARPSPQHVPSATGASHLNDLVDLIAQESSVSSLPPPSSPSPADVPPPNDNSNNVDLLQDLLSNSQQQQNVELLNFTSRNPSLLVGQTALLTNQMPPTSQNTAVPPNQMPSVSQSTVFSSNQSIGPNLNSNLGNSTTLASNAFSSLTQEAFAAASVLNTDVSSTPSFNLSNTSSSSPLTTSSIPTSALNATSTLLSNVSTHSSSSVLSSSVLSISPCLSASSVSSSNNAVSHSNGAPLDLISGASRMSNSKSQNILDLTHSNSLGSSNLLSNGLGTSITTMNTSASSIPLNFSHLSPNAPGGQSQNKNIISASSGQNVHSMNKTCGAPNGTQSPSNANKLKALKDLDELVGESLNRLGLNEEGAGAASQAMAGERGTNVVAGKEGTMKSEVSDGGEDDEQLLLDDFTLEETSGGEKKGPEPTPTAPKPSTNSTLVCPTPHPASTPCDNSKLADISIRLEDILPSEMKPIQALADSITILVHCTRSRPKRNVAVFVITTTSKHKTELGRYLFQPVVPKGYKVRLQPPSSTSLPAFNPFLPSPAITQIMLVASQSTTDASPTPANLANSSTLAGLQGNVIPQQQSPVPPQPSPSLGNTHDRTSLSSQQTLVSGLGNAPHRTSTLGNVQGNGLALNNTLTSEANSTPSNSVSNRGNAPNLVNLQENGTPTCQTNSTTNLVNLNNLEETGSRGNTTNMEPSPSSCSREVCSICLKFVVSYEVDGETVSEMGEIRELPLSEL